jgi:hypothetical protein
MAKHPDLNPERVGSFWRWFKEHASVLEEMIDTSAVRRLSQCMDEALFALTEALGWEFGPGTEKDYQLSFTLKGDLQNLAFAEAVVCRAPTIDRWEFHAGRPPKKWDLRFYMYNKRKQQVLIDAAHWQYTLLGFSDNSLFDITILAPGLPSMDLAGKTQAATILLQGILGEVAFLRHIDRVEVVTQSTKMDEERLSSITNLAEHLNHLAGSAAIRKPTPDPH